MAADNIAATRPTKTEQSSQEPSPPNAGAARIAIAIAAAGYFVDLFDLILFSVVRVRSLTDLGVPKMELLDTGVRLLNFQMAGMLLGGILWGVLGDKRGRLSVLYGSIVLYSLANLANGFVDSVPVYAILRFLSGIGLAGELGAGVTLAMEMSAQRTRGNATTIIATVGVMGAATAAVVGDLFPWRTAYILGGVLGLSLLVLRMRLADSPMFARAKQAGVGRGRLSLLLFPRERLMRYLRVIAIGLPIWWTAAILITFSPEFGKNFGMTEIPTAGRAVLFYYLGLTAGDLASGVISQLRKTRKQVIGLFVAGTAGLALAYFALAPTSLPVFYIVCGLLGVANGYWAVFMTMAAEQFGTNIRSTVTTTVPNFVRGAVVPITLLFQALRPALGLNGAAIAVGIGVLAIAVLALGGLEESYGRSMDFFEE